MALISSFHSNIVGETKFHNNDQCAESKKVQLKNMKQGTGKLLLCPKCVELGRMRK